MSKLKPLVLLGAGIITLGGGAYLTALGRNIIKTPDPNDLHIEPNKHHIKHAYDDKASSYDDKVNLQERLSNITKYRKKLLSFAQGNVLEVAAGSSRNDYMPLLEDQKINSVTMVDYSEYMLEQAEKKSNSSIKKLLKKHEESKVGMTHDDATRSPFYFLKMDAHELQFQENVFDTVISTFSLCSMEDPTKVIQEMMRVVKPGGRLLFLEHGRSHSFPIVNRLLDNTAKKRYEHWGCIYNRDIESYFKHVEGVVVDVVEHHHLGTCVMIVAQKGFVKPMPQTTFKPKEVEAQRLPCFIEPPVVETF